MKSQVVHRRAEEGYPTNLLLEIEITDYSNPTINKDLQDMLETLSDREQQVIKMRFVENKTLNECGSVFGVTGERVRGIEAKALRKLRHPTRQRRILYGSQYIQYRQMQCQIDEARKLLDKLNEEIKIKQEKLKEMGVDVQPYEAKEICPTIDDLDLTTRSYNCLRRAGYKTLDSLKGVKVSQLLKIRNMGKAHVIEVVDQLKKYGIDIEWDIRSTRKEIEDE